MAAPKRVPDELLSDSEATLRLVDSLVSELAAPRAVPRPRFGGPLRSLDAGDAATDAPADLRARAFVEILGIVDTLQQGRHAVRRFAAERLRHAGQAPDILSGQLAHAADFLADLELRLSSVLALFDAPDSEPPA